MARSKNTTNKETTKTIVSVGELGKKKPLATKLGPNPSNLGKTGEAGNRKGDIHAVADAAPHHPSLGQRIRTRRRERDWSLNQLAELSDIAPSTLSKVENDILTLNYDRLQAVAGAFGLGLSEFLADASSTFASPRPVMARRSLFRFDQAEVISTPNYEYRYLCTDLVVKSMVPIFSIVRARSLDEFGPMLRHDGEEVVFVIKGEVTIHTEFYKPECMRAMQGVYIDSTMGHAYINSGDGEAWIVSVNTSAIPETSLSRK
jgi:transcriptional regulator with XRE-family HTH domain